MDGNQEEAFNNKKNLNLDFITTKFNFKGEPDVAQDDIAASIIAQKPNITKQELLIKIDEILNNKGDQSSDMCDKITEALKLSKKKIFNIKHRIIKPELKDIGSILYEKYSENDNSESEEIEEDEDDEKDEEDEEDKEDNEDEGNEEDVESIKNLIKKEHSDNNHAKTKTDSHIGNSSGIYNNINKKIDESNNGNNYNNDSENGANSQIAIN